MKRFSRVLAIAVVGVLVVAVIAFLALPTEQKQRAGGRFRAEGPVPVLATAAQVADVPVYLDGVGTTKALNTVTVRPQVDGKIVSITFDEGQDVKRGDVLARIDSTVYQAQYDQAVAKKAQDEAQLANARLDLERYQRLAQAASKQQADTQRALVAQLEGLVKADQAAIDNAKAVLDYTTIRAPIDGRTGIRLVDEGNIVRASDATGIVVITQIRPISVLFNLPQQQVGRLNRAFSEGTLPVDVIGPDNRTISDRGKLQVVDNQIDPTTGTVRLKAEFPNAELQLWPGQFVNVRLLVDTLRQVVVVPTAAVQRGPQGTFVYLAQPDDTAAVRAVSVSQQDDTRAVIAKGLSPGDRVVTTGFSRLSDGASIAVASPEPQAAPPVASDRPAGRKKRRDGSGETTSGETTRKRSEAAPATRRP
jgi:multidrug efflux system membrane fusion protein